MNPLCALTLAARGISTPEEADRLLSCPDELPADPYLMRDMDRAVARIRAALDAGETISVYGDYDVDGITATSLLTDFLREQGARVVPYIPNRMDEGYGVNAEAVRTLHSRGVTLLVTVDCGITADPEELNLRELGMDLIVTDHHECKDSLPDAAAVVDPHRPDCPYPFKDLAGVGVALMLACAIVPEAQRRDTFLAYSGLACVGTIADVMPLVGVNRTIVATGFAQMGRPDRPGLSALIREARLKREHLTASQVSYVLAPRINASGRMGCAEIALRLFLTPDADEAEKLAKQLCALNLHRQSVESEICEACLEQLPQDNVPAAIVLAGEDWHQGVIGIAASKLAEKFRRPAFIISLNGPHGKGSCRTCGDINLFQALNACSEDLEGFGGHEQAAGFTIRRDRIPAFREHMCRYVAQRQSAFGSVLHLDAEIADPGLLTRENIASLAALEPCGPGNPRPSFAMRDCRVMAAENVGGGRHLKMRLLKNGCSFGAIFFSATQEEAAVSQGDSIDIAFLPQINEFMGHTAVQLQLLDLRPRVSRAERDRELFGRLVSGEPLTEAEAQRLLPARAEFAALWRYLYQTSGGQSLTSTPVKIARAVSHYSRRQETTLRIDVCLNVFDELGLISVTRSSGTLNICINEIDHKVDLREATVMRRLYKALHKV